MAPKPPEGARDLSGYLLVNIGNEHVSQFDIDTLERQVDELTQICTRLREENTWLRARLATLTEERAQLVEKTELARCRVESMISRLKSTEEGL